MSEINYRKAIGAAIGDALETDPRVVFFGEDVAVAGGAFKATPGLVEKFGPLRVRDTPIAEQAIIGTAIGAAMTGLRPIAEIMFADFAGVSFDQLANQLAKARYMSGGVASVPVVVRMSNGAGSGFAAQHSQPAENWFLNVPGLKIAVPGTVEDVFYLMRAAVEDPDPVLFFEHKSLFAIRGHKPELRERPVLGKGVTARPGRDVTLVATQMMRHRALDAAGRLAAQGIEVEVIDPRTLVPFDTDLVCDSLARTSRLAVVQEGIAPGSWGASLINRLTCEHFELFDAPPTLICSPPTPVPYARTLEEAWIPTTERITTEIDKLVKY